MPRRAAIDALAAIDGRDAFSNVALDRALTRRQIGGRDAALATEIVYGVLKQLRFLDDVLDRWLKKPISKLDPFGRAALRAGAYQLIFLDRVPAHAALSETVAVAKRRGKWRGGLTNAVLRKVAKGAKALRSEVEAPPSSAADLAVAYGLPDALASGLVERLGLEAAISYGKAAQSPPPVTLRIRPGVDVDAVAAAIVARGGAVERGIVVPRALRVRGAGAPGGWSEVAAGAVVVQDEGSQLVGHVVAPRAGHQILDLCAGRGGKTFHLADLLAEQDPGHDPGQIVAFDTQTAKLDVLERDAERLGIGSLQVARRAEELVALGPFDVVLVDAPCTGIGNLRRHPEVRWKWSAERLAELEAIQRDLLDRAADLVKPGGALVYSVCSDWPSEGAGQIDALLARDERFVRALLPEGVDWSPVVTAVGEVLVQPHLHDADGFYACRLRRLE